MSEDFINSGKLNDNKKNIMIVIGIILAIIVICYFLKKYVWEEKTKCVNYDAQKRIADEVDAKLKELDVCDCKLDQGLIRTKLNTTQKISNNPKKSKIEEFGNTNFY
jgi:hypothetical protein